MGFVRTFFLYVHHVFLMIFNLYCLLFPIFSYGSPSSFMFSSLISSLSLPPSFPHSLSFFLPPSHFLPFFLPCCCIFIRFLFIGNQSTLLKPGIMHSILKINHLYAFLKITSVTSFKSTSSKLKLTMSQLLSGNRTRVFCHFVAWLWV